MNKIIIDAKENSPYMMVDAENYNLTIKGNSYMTNPSQFYHFLSGVMNNIKVPESKMFEINITMGYYNTSSIQIINIILKTLCTANEGKVKISFFIDKEEDELLETAMSLAFNTNVKPIIEYY